VAKKRRSRSKKRNTRRQRQQSAKRSLRFPLPRRRYVPVATEKPNLGRVTRVARAKTAKTEVIHTKPLKRRRGKKLGFVLTRPEKRRMMVCKRRQQRKEIIHAVGKAGQGGQRKPKHNTRDVKC
jgi:hypothetical protein